MFFTTGEAVVSGMATQPWPVWHALLNKALNNVPVKERKDVQGNLIPVVAAALIDAQGRVLLHRRAPGKHHELLWEYPGGKVEPGESAAEAVLREIAEELGVALDPAALEPVSFAQGTGSRILSCSMPAGAGRGSRALWNGLRWRVRAGWARGWAGSRRRRSAIWPGREPCRRSM
jgi:8-oxo-dGTP pyrophosphatase MutT (NUDIX family)